jgi:hypothetical protein
MLPPLLALRRERAAFLASLGDVPYEAMVRAGVADFNQRLLDQYRRPIDGPLIAVGVLDLAETLAAWRSARPAPPPSSEPDPAPPRRRPSGGAGGAADVTEGVTEAPAG